MRMWRISCNSTLIARLDIVLLPDTSCKDNGQDYLGVNVTQVCHNDCWGWHIITGTPLVGVNYGRNPAYYKLIIITTSRASWNLGKSLGCQINRRITGKKRKLIWFVEQPIHTMIPRVFDFLSITKH